MGKINCCRDCPNRYPACHDTCETYQEQKAEYLEMTRVIKKSKYKDAIVTSYTIEATSKNTGKKLRCI